MQNVNSNPKGLPTERPEGAECAGTPRACPTRRAHVLYGDTLNLTHVSAERSYATHEVSRLKHHMQLMRVHGRGDAE
jgi:hypothetical protein